MASLYKRKDRKKKPYIIKTKDPISWKWIPYGYKTEEEAELELKRFELIEEYAKTNNPAWKALYFKTEKSVTVGEIFDAYRDNELTKKRNQLTINKYESVMKSVTGNLLDDGSCVDVIFTKNTPIETIRGASKKIDNNRKLGWEIYKTIREKQGRTRRGINSYLSELRSIFTWARHNGGKHGRGMVDFEVITLSDKYKDAELPEEKCKVWLDDEIKNLMTNQNIPTYLRELIDIYVYTGARATELLRYNYLNRKKELQWHHIDFKERKIATLTKGKKSANPVRQHPRVMEILAKWQKQGFKAPLPFGYKKLQEYIETIGNITGIKFTCHDLRRLKSQMTEQELNDIRFATQAIGDTSDKMVAKSYAPQSDATMDVINDAVHSRLTRKSEVN